MKPDDQTARADEVHSSSTKQLETFSLTLMEDSKYELDELISISMDRVVTAINNLHHNFQRDATRTRTLDTQVVKFRGSRGKFLEFQHLRLGKLQLLQNRIVEESKLHFFPTPFCDKNVFDFHKLCGFLQRQPFLKTSPDLSRINSSMTHQKNFFGLLNTVKKTSTQV